MRDRPSPDLEKPPPAAWPLPPLVVGAPALARGRGIVLRHGRCRPRTPRGRVPLAHEHRGDRLLEEFAAKFPGAAKLITGKPGAEQLVRGAAVKGVKFGGFAEDGPGKAAWPYTVDDTVYAPKARTDAVVAMSDFLFELNNAIRRPEFDKNTQDASAKRITPEQFARRKVELEVEGMLRMGMIWFGIKGGDRLLDKYDNDFFLAQYTAFKEKRKTKARIVDEVLQWRNGADPSKTNERYYMDQYPK